MAEPYVSRHERRLQERAQHTSGGGMTRGTRRFLLWGGGALVLVLLGWGMVRLSANVVVPTRDGTLADPVTERDHISGPASASITLVEYSDFQCPACGAFYPVIKKLLAEPQMSGAVRFVYRSFPLTAIHTNAQLAAQAAEAAAAQGKFWEMHDALFEHQNSWSGLSGAGARAAFLDYAKASGLDLELFASALDSGTVKERVKEAVAGGTRSGVDSTPTFFLNGARMAQPNSYEEFRQTVLNAATPRP